MRIAPRNFGCPSGSDVVVVGVRDQGELAGALDRGLQLALVLRLGAGDAARDDLAVLGQVLAQRVEILVVDLLDALGRELAELAAAEKLAHVGLRSRAQAASSEAAAAVPIAFSSSSRRGRRSPFSSLLFMISDCSVTASSRAMTMWRRTASLKRKPSTSSVSAFCVHSMLSST